MVYTREFLINAFIWRYTEILLKMDDLDIDRYVMMVSNFYDTVGKEVFRVYCGLDAAKIKEFRLATGQ